MRANRRNIAEASMKKVAVIFENRKKRELVGELTHVRSKWVFQYDKKWEKKGISLDMELPITGKPVVSKFMPEFFAERIPPKESGTFTTYAKIWGLTEELSDPMALLVTLGHRGPSNYVFDPVGFFPGKWKESI